MPKLIILGTSNAIPDEHHENTHMAVVGEERLLLVDCVNTPTVRLKKAGLNLDDLTDLVLTHFHPDHVSGVPSLLMNSWLMGRHGLLNIYGLEHTLERIRKLMDFYDWGNWPNFFPVEFHNVPDQEIAPLFDCSEFSLYASPVCHMVPTIGLRIEFTESGKVLAYSCDTEPCEAVVKLAYHADILIHEATGATFGHSSAAQAGEIAKEAAAGQLYLIHYNTWDSNPHLLIKQAEETFDGPIYLAEDFMEFDF